MKQCFVCGDTSEIDPATKCVMARTCPFSGHSKTRRNISNVLHVLLMVSAGLAPLLYMYEIKKSNTHEELFKASIAAADAGRWVWDLKTGDLEWDDQMFKLYGRSKESWGGDYDSFIACIHPEDVEKVKSEINTCLAEKKSYKAVFRVVTEKGEVRLISASGKLTKNGKHMTGINLEYIQ